MSFPRFPESRLISLEDKPFFDDLLARRPPGLSAYTFTNIYAWSEPYHTRVSGLDGSIIVWHEDAGRIVPLEPLCDCDPGRVIRQCFDLADRPVTFERLSAHTAQEFADDPAFAVAHDRDNSDYVYRSSDLIDLPGRKYDGKRNFINRFEPDAFEYVPITVDMIDECVQFADKWCEDRKCETVEGLRREHCAVYQMLTNFGYLGVLGGAIRMNGSMVAFSLGEALNSDTLVIHVEKAHPHISGLYQLINNQFCLAEARNYDFVNREQDLGVPGLRKAKESYHPTRMEKAFTLELK